MLLGLTLPVLLLSGCSLVRRGYDPTTRTIRLREAPLPVKCWRGAVMDECVEMLEQDWETLVIDYKAKCLQLGGSPVACQTVEDHRGR